MHTTPTAGNRGSEHHPFKHFRNHRKKVTVISFSIMALLLALTYGAVRQSVLATNGRSSAPAPANSAVFTYKNDLARTGQFSNETTLNTSNVNPSQFGKRISYKVDGQVYAEPLFVPNLTINGNTYNVVIVATEHDSIYAFDADQTTPTAPLWHTSFLGSSITTVSSSQVACNDINPEYGITSTPVIDGNSNTMYLVANTMDHGTNTYRLHAIDITTGHDKSGSPKTISATAQGTGAGNVNGVIKFNPVVEGQRGGLLLTNGRVYMDFGSHCDNGAYHGWIMSYKTSDLSQVAAYNDTKDGNQAGVWEGGDGLTADANNHIYVMTGNGTFNRNTGGRDLGDSFIKLDIATGELQVVDYFTPFNQACLDAGDTDLGSSGVVLLPGNELLGSGKEGRLYVVNQNSLGGYHTISNVCNNQNRTDVDQIVQEAPRNTAHGGIWGTPAFWNGSNGQYVYTGGVSDHLKAFKFSNGKISLPASSQAPETLGFPGTNPVISSDGTTPGTGIVWSLEKSNILHAYDATDLSKELYNSNQQTARDALDSYTKFSVPTVANGEVFVGTKTSLVIYGKLSSSGPAVYNNIGISDDGQPTSANYDGGGKSYSQQALAAVGITQNSTIAFNGVNFTWPDVPSGSADNYSAVGQTVNFSSNSGDTTLAFLGSSTNGPSSGTATITYTDNSTSNFTLAFSDWTLNGGKSSPITGNQNVSTQAYRNTATGKEIRQTHVFYTETNIAAGKTVQSVTLPSITNQGIIHVFVIGSKVAAGASFNNTGISNDSSPASANFDGGGKSYSQQTLTNAHYTQGATVSFNGVNFTWPNVAAGSPDNFNAQGQRIDFSSNSGDTTLAFLGSSTNGPSSGTATITYTDNSTSTFTLAFSDWTLNAGKSTPISSNKLAVRLPYRNSSGTKDTDKPVILYTDTSITSGKTVKSVTLPASVSQGHLHVFAIGSK